MKTIEINLDLPPQHRWDFAIAYQHEIDEIIACYWVDFEEYVDFFLTYLEAYKKQFVPVAYWQEIKGIANYSRFSADQILIANLYYDIIKFAFACTAFAYEKDQSIWHARNLDWWTENDILKKHTKIFKFTKNGQTIFQSVGWMGFVGVLSGYKPGAFSVTLNAIVSEEAPNIAKPITFILREVLEANNNFLNAQKILEQTEIVCDCLLLLAGVQASEMVVIERTPRTSKTRKASNGRIIVTNNYQLIDAKDKPNDILQSTSCARYDQTNLLLQSALPSNSLGCFQILNHPYVKMQITVQQMVFNPRLEILALKD